MKMPYARAIPLNSFQGIAAAIKIMARVQTKADQIRIRVFTQPFDLSGCFNECADVVMEGDGKTPFTASHGYTTENLHSRIPLLLAHCVPLFDYATSHRHARFAHL